MIRDGEVDLCTENPGKDVDLYIKTTLRCLVEIWNGDVDIRTALNKERIKTQGDAQLARTMPDWLGICLYADVRPGDPALKKIAVEDLKAKL